MIVPVQKNFHDESVRTAACFRFSVFVIELVELIPEIKADSVPHSRQVQPHGIQNPGVVFAHSQQFGLELVSCHLVDQFDGIGLLGIAQCAGAAVGDLRMMGEIHF